MNVKKESCEPSPQIMPLISVFKYVCFCIVAIIG